MIEHSYYRDTQKTYLVIPTQIASEQSAGYQYKMISVNRISGLLPCSLRQIDGKISIYYDISGMQNLRNLYSSRMPDTSSVCRILYSLAAAGKRIARFLLDQDRILLDGEGEFVYYDFEKDQFCFVYYPEIIEDSSAQNLLQFLRRVSDTQDMELAKMLIRLMDRFSGPGSVIREEDLNEICQMGRQGALPDGSMQTPGRMEDRFSEGNEYRKEMQQPEEKDDTDAGNTKNKKSGLSVFGAALGFLCGAAGLEMLHLYVPLENEADMAVRSGILGCLLLAVMIAAYGALTVKRKQTLPKQEKKTEEESGGEEKREMTQEKIRNPGRAMASPGFVAEERIPYGWVNDPASYAQVRTPYYNERNTGYEERRNQMYSREYGREYAPMKGPVREYAKEELKEHLLQGEENSSMYRISLKNLPCTIGSMAGFCDVILQNPSVDRMHCRFERGQGDYLCAEDLNSQGGTWVNGKRLSPGEKQLLYPGDEIRIGELKFSYRIV